MKRMQQLGHAIAAFMFETWERRFLSSCVRWKNISGYWMQIGVRRCLQTCPVYSRKRVYPQLKALLIEGWCVMGRTLASQQWEHQRHSYCFACCCDWRAITVAGLIDSRWDYSQKWWTNVFPWVTSTQLKRQLQSQRHSQLVVWTFLWLIQSKHKYGWLVTHIPMQITLSVSHCVGLFY